MKDDLAKLMYENLKKLSHDPLWTRNIGRSTKPMFSSDYKGPEWSEFKEVPKEETVLCGEWVVDLITDVVGLVPLFGDAVDLGNTARFIYCEKYFDAIISAAAIVIPVAIAARWVGRSGLIDAIVDFIIKNFPNVKNPVAMIMNPIKDIINQAIDKLKDLKILSKNDDKAKGMLEELNNFEKEIELTYKRRMKDTARFDVPDKGLKEGLTPEEIFEDELKALEALTDIHGKRNVVGFKNQVMDDRDGTGIYHLLEELKGGTLGEFISDLKNHAKVNKLSLKQKNNAIKSLESSKNSLNEIKKKIKESGVPHGDLHEDNVMFRSSPYVSL